MNRIIILLAALLIVGCEDGRNGPEGPRGPAGTNGTNGINGQDATLNPYSVVEVITPCPSSGFREVILRLHNGDLLAHYSHGSKQFLTFLTPGTYQLTDGSSCVFTVHSDMSVTW